MKREEEVKSDIPGELRASSRTRRIARVKVNGDGSYSWRDTRYMQRVKVHERGYSTKREGAAASLLDKLPPMGDLKPLLGVLKKIQELGQ